MYWDNPLIEVSWPGRRDPIQESLHGGQHAIYYDASCDFSQVQTNQRLQDLCDWANQWLEHDGIDQFVADARNHYDIANLVKLNMWIDDIRRQGIVKPWLLLDSGDGCLIPGTGDSRLRCLERLPHITRVPAFICTHQNRAHVYHDLLPITDLDGFANHCGARQDQLFLFRLTDNQAPYGLCWYEYNSDLTRSVTPGQEQAVAWFYQYARSRPNFRVTPDWFDRLIDWTVYDDGS